MQKDAKFSHFVGSTAEAKFGANEMDRPRSGQCSSGLHFPCADEITAKVCKGLSRRDAEKSFVLNRAAEADAEPLPFS